MFSPKRKPTRAVISISLGRDLYGRAAGLASGFDAPVAWLVRRAIKERVGRADKPDARFRAGHSQDGRVSVTLDLETHHELEALARREGIPISLVVSSAVEELVNQAPRIAKPDSSPDANPRRSPPVVLHPARLLPWKGAEISLRMLRILADRGQDAVLVITDTQRIADWHDELAGYRGLILALIEELDLGGRVRFVDAASTQMPRLYADADVVIYPTIGDEPYGLVPLEAMSCGRPVVASLSGG